ncbi:molybdate ABC transporter substrate-binding protein [Massilia sp. erpn]|uniref:molybdate ABC transporter substrate-binding protein n=1 Tax=Massilia sp. erpn TaxID=2738142 RepID=UPI002105AD9C|nr:molybdate ABC transporter substrate-binding protein [Massilia sp. erpn]UTY60325.1 molybdate ABC transporter substrate-binding protein [Massilia sp. erpn]
MLKKLCLVTLLAAAGLANAADITVSAAASLTNAFRELSQAYEAANPGDKVLLNFAASDALVQQISKGAPVDVFASADQEAMDKAEGMKLLAAGSRHNFVSNSVVLITPSTSTLALKTLGDLRGADVKRITTGNPASVPIGRYTKQALEKAGVWSNVETKFIFGTSVRQSLDYVARGEVDAGFVYATDVGAQKDKVKAQFTVPTDTPVTYPISALSGAANAKGARQFVDFTLSSTGQAILAKYGFGRP